MKDIMSVVWIIITLIALVTLILGLFKYSHNIPHDMFVNILRISFGVGLLGVATLLGLTED